MDSGSDDQAQGPKDVNKTLVVRFEGEQRSTEHAHSKMGAPNGALGHLKAHKAHLDTQRGQGMLVQGTEGPEAYTDPAMPHRFPEGTHLGINFVKSLSEQKENNPLFGQSNECDADSVNFNNYAVDKREEKIVYCDKLNDSGNKHSVSVKMAPCLNGRFLTFQRDSVGKGGGKVDGDVESWQSMHDLDGRDFKEHRSSGAACAQNSDSGDRNTGAGIDQESENCREYIEEEMKGSEGKDQLFNKSEMEFLKMKEARFPVIVHKRLYNLSKSVGYLSWNKGNNRGSATCFVFNNLFIFTCWHVIRDIVEGERDPTKWAGIVSACVMVSFGYEMETEKEKNCFFLAPWLEVTDESLDYAVLKLQPAEGVQVPYGLYIGFTPKEYGSKLYIIGHPEGKPKTTESVSVIPVEKRKQECGAREAEIPYGHMSTQRGFQDKSSKENVVTYHTSFYHGASGSPLFDSEGLLVAMHAAGLNQDFSLEGGNNYLIEFGPSMHCILNHIKQNFPDWHQEIVYRPDEEMLGQNY